MKAMLRRALLGDVAPQWVPVAVRHPQSLVTVTLHGLGEPRDVTANNVVASLRPLRFALGLSAAETAAARQADVRLDFTERTTGTVLGSLALRCVDALADDTYAILAVAGRSYRVLPAFRRLTRHLNEVRKDRAPREPGNFWMPSGDRRDLRIFYFAPRPVVLITARHGERGNLFPMDLLGPIDGGRFSLALRSTSPSVELMRESRRLILSRIPASYTDFAYELGKHHRKSDIDWAGLPFATRPSEEFGWPVPEEALSVHELSVELTQEIGSHTVFLTRPSSEQFLREGEAMHHVAGDLQQVLARAGRAVPEAPRTSNAPIKMGAG